MKNILTYGTFDSLHWGHIKLLKKAKEMGDYLYVGVSTDEFNEIKGKKSIFNEIERVKLLEDVPYVDEIIMENDWAQKEKDIEKYGIDILVMGEDWEGEFNDLPCKVVYLPRTEGISTNKIKQRCLRRVI